jgi:hypothetical protein
MLDPQPELEITSYIPTDLRLVIPVNLDVNTCLLNDLQQFDVNFNCPNEKKGINLEILRRGTDGKKDRCGHPLTVNFYAKRNDKSIVSLLGLISQKQVTEIIAKHCNLMDGALYSFRTMPSAHFIDRLEVRRIDTNC